jgi:uncharacterized cysteine cluster protein YcgN (CxxCxxCC family)
MSTNRFSETRGLLDLDPEAWESLCDGCGRCCLRKLEDEDTGAIAYTDVACRLLDRHSCRCRDYDHRLERVPDCVELRPDSLDALEWMPTTCAYRLVASGQPLPDWHHLRSGSRETVHAAGISVRGRCVSEENVHDDDVGTRIVHWVSADE